MENPNNNPIKESALERGLLSSTTDPNGIIQQIATRPYSEEYKRDTAYNASRKQVRIRVYLSAEDRNYLSNTVYPFLDLEFSATSGSGHGLANARRVIEQELAVARCSRHQKVVDVGGNFYHYIIMGRENFHCCCPLLSHRDSARLSTRVYNLDTWIKEQLNEEPSPGEAGNKRAVKKQRAQAVIDSPGQFYCRKMAQHCFVRADVLLFLDSLYDIPVDDIAHIMFSHKAKKGYGYFIFQPEMMTDDRGYIRGLNCEWEKKMVRNPLMVSGVEVGETESIIIEYRFREDSSWTYQHDYDNLMLLASKQMVKYKDYHYLIERSYDNGIVRLEITLIEAVSVPSTLSFSYWKEGYKNRVGVRVFDLAGLSRTSTTRNIRSMIAWIDSALVQQLVSYCLRLSEEKFTPKTVYDYAVGVNARFTVNGVDVTVKVCTDTMLAYRISFSLWWIAFCLKFDQNYIQSVLVRRETQRRNLRVAGLTQLMLMRFTEAVAGAKWFSTLTSEPRVFSRFADSLVQHLSQSIEAGYELPNPEIVDIDPLITFEEVCGEFESGFRVSTITTDEFNNWSNSYEKLAEPMGVVKTLDLLADRIRSTPPGKDREVLEDCTKMLLRRLAVLDPARHGRITASWSAREDVQRILDSVLPLSGGPLGSHRELSSAASSSGEDDAEPKARRKEKKKTPAKKPSWSERINRAESAPTPKPKVKLPGKDDGSYKKLDGAALMAKGAPSDKRQELAGKPDEAATSKAEKTSGKALYELPAEPYGPDEETYSPDNKPTESTTEVIARATEIAARARETLARIEGNIAKGDKLPMVLYNTTSQGREQLENFHELCGGVFHLGSDDYCGVNQCAVGALLGALDIVGYKVVNPKALPVVVECPDGSDEVVDPAKVLDEKALRSILHQRLTDDEVRNGLIQASNNKRMEEFEHSDIQIYAASLGFQLAVVVISKDNLLFMGPSECSAFGLPENAPTLYIAHINQNHWQSIVPGESDNRKNYRFRPAAPKGGAANYYDTDDDDSSDNEDDRGNGGIDLEAFLGESGQTMKDLKEADLEDVDLEGDEKFGATSDSESIHSDSSDETVWYPAEDYREKYAEAMSAEMFDFGDAKPRVRMPLNGNRASGEARSDNRTSIPSKSDKADNGEPNSDKPKAAEAKTERTAKREVTDNAGTPSVAELTRAAAERASARRKAKEEKEKDQQGTANVNSAEAPAKKGENTKKKKAVFQLPKWIREISRRGEATIGDVDTEIEAPNAANDDRPDTEDGTGVSAGAEREAEPAGTEEKDGEEAGRACSGEAYKALKRLLPRSKKNIRVRKLIFTICGATVCVTPTVAWSIWGTGIIKFGWSALCWALAALAKVALVTWQPVVLVGLPIAIGAGSAYMAIDQNGDFSLRAFASNVRKSVRCLCRKIVPKSQCVEDKDAKPLKTTVGTPKKLLALKERLRYSQRDHAGVDGPYAEGWKTVDQRLSEIVEQIQDRGSSGTQQGGTSLEGLKKQASNNSQPLFMGKSEEAKTEDRSKNASAPAAADADNNKQLSRVDRERILFERTKALVAYLDYVKQDVKHFTNFCADVYRDMKTRGDARHRYIDYRYQTTGSQVLEQKSGGYFYLDPSRKSRKEALSGLNTVWVPDEDWVKGNGKLVDATYDEQKHAIKTYSSSYTHILYMDAMNEYLSYRLLQAHEQRNITEVDPTRTFSLVSQLYQQCNCVVGETLIFFFALLPTLYFLFSPLLFFSFLLYTVCYTSWIYSGVTMLPLD